MALKSALQSRGVAATMAFMLLTGSFGAAGAVGVGGICGPILHGACDPGLFCEHSAGTCKLLGGTGKCVSIPDVCASVVLQVCGCNGKTYANDCERIKAQVRKNHDGPCQ